MQNKLIMTLMSFSVLFLGCIGNANTAENRMTVRNPGNSVLSAEINSKPVVDSCEDWEVMKSKLNDLEKERFEENGIIFVDQSKDAVGYLLSHEIVQDCEMRVKIGRFVWAIVTGNESSVEQRFAKQNSEIIVSVLLKIWDLREFSRDGVASEKYSLVNYVHFNDKDNLLLLSYLLKEKKLNTGLVSSVLRRPNRQLVPLLEEMLKQAEEDNNLTEQVCFAMMLEQASKDHKMLPRLKLLAANKKLSLENRTIINSIVGKFKKNKGIVSEDYENLQLDLIDHEENRSSKPD